LTAFNCHKGKANDAVLSIHVVNIKSFNDNSPKGVYLLMQTTNFSRDSMDFFSLFEDFYVKDKVNGTMLKIDVKKNMHAHLLA